MSSLISIGQVVDQSVHHYGKSFKALMGVSLFLLAGMPFVVAGRVLFDDADATRLWLSIGCEIVGIIVTAIASYWVFNALVYAVDAQAAGKRANMASVSKAAWKQFVPAVGVSVLVGLLLLSTVLLLAPGYALLFLRIGDTFGTLAVGALLLFAGGFSAAALAAWVAITFIFAPYALLLENTGVRGALRRARELVRGRWFPVMLRVLVPKVTILVVALFLQYVLIIALSLLSASSGPGSLLFFIILADLMKVGFSVLVTPLFVLADYYVFESLVDTAKKSAA